VADIPHHVLLQHPKIRRHASALHHLDAPAGRWSKRSKDDRDQPRDIRASLRYRKSGPQARDRLEAEITEPCVVPVELENLHEARVCIAQAELRRQYANNLAWLRVNADRPAQHASISSKLALPVSIGQKHGVRAAGRSVLVAETPAQHWLHTEDFEHAIRNVERRNLLGFGNACYAHAVGAPHPDILKRLPLFAVNEIARGGHWHVLDVDPRRRMNYRHQFFGVRVGQWLQQYAFNHAEDSRIGSD